MESIKDSGWIKCIVWGAKFLRFIRLQKIVSAVKKRASLDLTSVLHREVVHKIRRLSPNLRAESWAEGLRDANDMCSASRLIMGNLLEIPEDKIHCCLKILVPKKTPDDEDTVITLARSDPSDSRLAHSEKDYFVSKNSVWSAILGVDDGVTRWKEPFKCFSCNNLPAQESKFVCQRENWQNYYRSTIVFPVNYMIDPNDRLCMISGFLAFDSPMKNAFGGIPNIYDYSENSSEYYTILKNSSIFHLGASIADTLGVALEPVVHSGE